MKTKKLFVVVFTLFLVGNVFASTVKEKRETGSFTKISVESGVDLYFTQANSKLIEVEADDKIITNVITVVEDNTLVVKVKKTRLFGNNKTIKVYVTYPEIKEVNVSGGADFYCKELNCGSTFILNASGGADAEIKNLLAGNNVKINTSGGADIEINSLKSPNCTLSASGGGDIEATVTISDILEINASGGADISVKGQTKSLNVNASGGADIHIKNLSYSSINSNKSGGADIHK